MSMPAGKEEYNVSNEKVIAFGVSHTFDEMQDALQHEIYEKVYDLREHTEIVENLGDTGFDKAILMENLFPIVDKEEWEIGEAYAQAYLEANMYASVPWGISRDIKKPGSSLPGADIVGIHHCGNNVCFLFGEIKTSSQKVYPPSVMYGDTGLKKQLEDLCEDKKITDALVRYLAYRLKNTDMWEDYRKALTQYLGTSGNGVHIVGVLVRDVTPYEDDLSARAKKLQKYVLNGRSVELLGIYLPVHSIPQFSKVVREEYERRSISDDKQQGLK